MASNYLGLFTIGKQSLPTMLLVDEVFWHLYKIKILEKYCIQHFKEIPEEFLYVYIKFTNGSCNTGFVV